MCPGNRSVQIIFVSETVHVALYCSRMHAQLIANRSEQLTRWLSNNKGIIGHEAMLHGCERHRGSRSGNIKSDCVSCDIEAELVELSIAER